MNTPLALVPAFNEEQTVGAVVEGLLSEAQVDPNALADAFAVPRPVIEAALVVPPAKASAQASPRPCVAPQTMAFFPLSPSSMLNPD